MRRWVSIPALAVVAAGCQERLTTPGQCPDLCPGTPIVVRDTTITATPGADSSFFGYLPRASRTALLVSSGLPAAEARAFVVFPKHRRDTVTVDGIQLALAIDTMSISFGLQLRDTTARSLVLYLHRIPITTDTTITFSALDSVLATAPIIDSIAVPDTLRVGRVEALFLGDEMRLLDTAPEDSNQVGIGLTVRATKPTGVRLGVDPVSANAPQLQSRGRVNVPDSTRMRQRVTVSPTSASMYGYVFAEESATAPDPDLLYVGGPQGARALVRFTLPRTILDSAQVLRATLELTPARPLIGLPDSPDRDTLAVAGVIADLGAKSPILLLPGLRLAGPLVEGTTAVVAVDVRQLVNQWQGSNGPPAVVLLQQLDEGNSFMQPVLYSTRSPVGQPRLRLTYGLGTRPGRP